MDIDKRKSLEMEIIRKAQEDEAFYRELTENPREAIQKHFGVNLPPQVKVNLMEENEEDLYLVVPLNPEKLPQGELSDEQMEQGT